MHSDDPIAHQPPRSPFNIDPVIRSGWPPRFQRESPAVVQVKSTPARDRSYADRCAGTSNPGPDDVVAGHAPSHVAAHEKAPQLFFDVFPIVDI
jgi:hypothetical protein